MKTKFDCIIVLGGGIVRTAEDNYAPTTYQHSDQYGMLGGHMRVIAAALLYLDGQADTFILSTGKSEKAKAQLGPDAPTGALAYSAYFKQVLRELTPLGTQGSEPPLPHIILEDASKNTAGNIHEDLSIIRQHSWHRVAFVSSNLHIPRIKSLAELALQTQPQDVVCDFLGAEDVVRKLRPGIYDQEIETAHTTPAARKREQSETQGLADLQNGNYVMIEFQLHQPQPR